jgi:hypothetical protein
LLQGRRALRSKKAPLAPQEFYGWLLHLVQKRGLEIVA